MTHGGTRGAQNSFKFQTGDDIGAGFVMIYVFQVAGIIGFTAGTQNYGSDIELEDFFLLAVIDGIGQTGIHTLVTFTAIPTI